MPIRAKCDSCGKAYSLKDSLAGKRIRCPACRGVVHVPQAGSQGASGRGASAGPAARQKAAPKPAPSKKASGRPKAAAPPKRKAPGKPTPPPGDPDATTYTPSPVARGRKPATEGATVCPACGKAMSPKQVTCSACGYNVKLRRRLSITDAIRKTDRAPGVRHDGTQYVTRAEKAEQRVEQGRKIRWGMLLLTVVLVLFFSLVATVVGYYAVYGPALETARQPYLEGHEAGAPLTQLKWLHPYCVGMSVNLEVPLEQVVYEFPKPAGEDFRGPAAPSHLAQVCRLPYSSPPHLVNPLRVLERMQELNGTYGPDALTGGMRLEDDAVLVWRQARPADQKGFLSGALIDAGKRQIDMAEEIKKAKETRRARTITIQGTLTFVASRIGDLETGGYAYAVRQGILELSEKLDRIPDGTANFQAPDGNKETDDRRVFHPVILLEGYTIQ